MNLKLFIKSYSIISTSKLDLIDLYLDLAKLSSVYFNHTIKYHYLIQLSIFAKQISKFLDNTAFLFLIEERHPLNLNLKLMRL